jgi:hypothetical protein
VAPFRSVRGLRIEAHMLDGDDLARRSRDELRLAHRAFVPRWRSRLLNNDEE